MEQRIELSAEQIQKIFKYTDYIEYKDVQCEIIDHLASGIEEQLQVTPEKSFNSALYDEISKLPLNGFTTFIQSKEKALTKYWFRKLLIQIIDNASLLKIILAVLSLSICFLICINIQPLYISFFGIILSSFVPTSYNTLVKFKEEKYLTIKAIKKVLDINYHTSFIFWLCTGYIKEPSITIIGFYATIITLHLILAFILNPKTMNRLLYDELNINYKHLFQEGKN